MGVAFTFKMKATEVAGKEQEAERARARVLPQTITSIRGHELPPGVLAIASNIPSAARALDEHAVARVKAIFDWARSIRDDKDAE